MSVTNLKLNLQRLHTMRTWSVSIRSIRALRSAVFLVCYNLINIFTGIYPLQINSFICYICSVAAKSVTGFGSPIHRRMYRLFKNWRFFCARNTLGTKTSITRHCPNYFWRVGWGASSRRHCDRSLNPPDRRSCLETGKVKIPFFKGAMS